MVRPRLQFSIFPFLPLSPPSPSDLWFSLNDLLDVLTLRSLPPLILDVIPTAGPPAKPTAPPRLRLCSLSHSCPSSPPLRSFHGAQILPSAPWTFAVASCVVPCSPLLQASWLTSQTCCVTLLPQICYLLPGEWDTRAEGDREEAERGGEERQKEEEQGGKETWTDKHSQRKRQAETDSWRKTDKKRKGEETGGQDIETKGTIERGKQKEIGRGREIEPTDRGPERSKTETKGDEARRALGLCWRNGSLVPSIPGILAFLPSSQQLILPGEPRSRAWYLILLPSAHPLPALEALAWLSVQDPCGKLQEPSSLPLFPKKRPRAELGWVCHRVLELGTSRIRKSNWLSDKLCDAGQEP